MYYGVLAWVQISNKIQNKIHWCEKLNRAYWSCSVVHWICPQGQCFRKISQIIKILRCKRRVKTMFPNYRHFAFQSNALLNFCNRFTSREKMPVCKNCLQILSITMMAYSFVWKGIKSSDMKWIQQMLSRYLWIPSTWKLWFNCIHALKEVAIFLSLRNKRPCK